MAVPPPRARCPLGDSIFEGGGNGWELRRITLGMGGGLESGNQTLPAQPVFSLRDLGQAFPER